MTSSTPCPFSLSLSSSLSPSLPFSHVSTFVSYTSLFILLFHLYSVNHHNTSFYYIFPCPRCAYMDRDSKAGRGEGGGEEEKNNPERRSGTYSTPTSSLSLSLLSSIFSFPFFFFTLSPTSIKIKTGHR